MVLYKSKSGVPQLYIKKCRRLVDRSCGLSELHYAITTIYARLNDEHTIADASLNVSLVRHLALGPVPMIGWLGEVSTPSLEIPLLEL